MIVLRLYNYCRLCNPSAALKDDDAILPLLNFIYDPWTGFVQLNNQVPFPNAVINACKTVSNFLNNDPGNYLGALSAVFKFHNISNFEEKHCLVFNEKYAIIGDPINDPDSASYSYQCCSQGTVTASEFSSDGTLPSILPPLTIPDELILTECIKAYGPSVPKPKPAYVAVRFMEKLKEIGHVVFTNGDLDGWSGGSILESIRGMDIAAVVYKNASHCTDTHSFNWNNTAEPEEYKIQRARAMDAAAIWMESFRAASTAAKFDIKADTSKNFEAATFA